MLKLLVLSLVVSCCWRCTFSATINFESCSQSGDYDIYSKCEKAMDGNSKNCKHHFVSITPNKHNNDFWIGKFKEPVYVNTVTIWNRVETLSLNRLSNFVIRTDTGEVCARYTSKKTFNTHTFNCRRVTTYLMIHLNGRNYLELCEVQVDGYAVTGFSVATVPFKTCSQHNNYNRQTKCTKAMDRDTKKCTFPNVSHSKSESNNIWLGVFAGPVKVSTVTIWNRLDSYNYHRLVNFVIKGDDGNICAEYKQKTTFLKRTFRCQIVTNTLTIQLYNKVFLELCEVEVEGQLLKHTKSNYVAFSNCHQSGNHNSKTSCKLAMDGRHNQCLINKGVSITPYKSKNFWVGTFAAKIKVNSVTIWNRWETLKRNRLVNFVVKTDSGKICAAYKSSSTFVMKTFSCDELTTSITIVLNGKNYLELCEVEVDGFVVDTNMIKMLPIVKCDQSSTYNAHTKCIKAIDSKHDVCTYPTAVSITKNNVGEWWTGYFGKRVYLNTVTIWNRKGTYKLNRLSNFVIKTSSGRICAEYPYDKTFQVRTFYCYAETESIRIQLNGKQYLELCEVQAYGTLKKVDYPQVYFSHCEQSTFYDKYTPCSKAMDGERNQCLPTSITGSSLIFKQEYWTGYFAVPVNVDSIVIWSNQDKKFDGQIVNFVIKTSTGKICAKYEYKVLKNVYRLSCKEKTSSITIVMPNKNWLDLCEVEVYGTVVKLY